MKLLQLITSMNPKEGGPCQGVRNLVPALLGHGGNTRVVCLDDPDSPYLQEEADYISALGEGRGSWKYHPALRPWLQECLPRFDAVAVNGLWQYPGFAMSRLAQGANVPPYFVFPHGMLDPWFQRAPERRLKALRNWCYWKCIEHQVIRRAEAVFFTCAEEMRLAQGTFRPYQPKRQVNVGFGISTPPEFRPRMAEAFTQRCPGVEGLPYFLFLGRIHPKKGVDLLIRAYAQHRRRMTEEGRASASLVVAGPGLKTEYGEQMQQLARDHCPAGSVFWPDMLTGDAKWGALYQAEAFVLFSHQENFGIAVAEAMACSTPVLISNQINIWREVRDSQAGFVDEDTVAGAERLLRTWTGLSLQDKEHVKAKARCAFERCFGIEAAARNVMNSIRELTALRRHAALS